ncbi:hypothetical protein LJC31_06095 [Synergistaceae bacterium OttesenSCG-928-I11]|nr:hypothetical protein [Synergistaceae bacterium OttesenSCG-928-I11]
MFDNRKTIGRIFIFIIFLISLPTWLFAARPMGGQLYRGILNSLPTKKIFKNMENAFSSGLFGSAIFSGFDTNLKFILTGQLFSAQVLLGKDGWLFYKSQSDGDSIGDFTGTAVFLEREKERILKSLTDANKYCSENGIFFTFLVAPNKENIYADKMPTEIVKVADKTRTDLLIEYLREKTKINIVYPKKELLDLCNQYQLWHKHDTHWSSLGAFVAVQQLIDSWGYGRSFLKNEKIKTILLNNNNKEADGDLAKMCHMTWLFKEKKKYSIDGEKVIDPKKFSEEQKEGFSHFVNPSYLHDETMLLIGDSFRVALVSHLFQQFHHLFVIHRYNYSPEILQKINPNRVIVEYVERYVADFANWKIM